MKMEGIHHITAIVGHPEQTSRFYGGVLGLRLVKTTVNFDDPTTYHLYFGDSEGSPGSIMTFFNWMNDYKGIRGNGQVGITYFLIPQGSFAFWQERLQSKQIQTKVVESFDEKQLHFEDEHGLQLALIERDVPLTNDWETSEIPAKYAIQKFGGALLYTGSIEATKQLLEKDFGYVSRGTSDKRERFSLTDNQDETIDLCSSIEERGSFGIGTVHHIAWRTKDAEEQLQWQQKLQAKYNVTPVQDRDYFESIYFREGGGIICEIATDEPGFFIDETDGQLGLTLQLPQQYEANRAVIESHIVPFQRPSGNRSSQ